MAWYEEAVFYHIYPLGLLGAPEMNDHGQPVHRLPELKAWVDHMKDCGFTALYLGPCFSSGSHGYDTEDYRRLDERLGDNEDLFTRELTAGDFNWVSVAAPAGDIHASARIRYRHREAPATIIPLSETSVRIIFDEPQRAITRGQSVVVYDGDYVLGGGIIR